VALGAISQGPAAWAVNRFGLKPTIIGGLGLMAAGLLLFARAPVGGRFLVDVLPGMLVLGAGASFAFMAVILAATAGVPENEAGLASGLVNTSQHMGGALGLAALAAVAAGHTTTVAGRGFGVAASIPPTTSPSWWERDVSFSAPSPPPPCSVLQRKRTRNDPATPIDQERPKVMDSQDWKQRREEMIRKAEQDRLARVLRGSRKRRGSGRTPSVEWEPNRAVGRLRMLPRSERKEASGG
jgi:hypothetical protein